MRLLRSPLFYLAPFIITGCSQYAEQPNTQWQLLQQQYKSAIEDAAVIEPDEIITVKTITQEKERFVTWTSYPDSYKAGEPSTLAWSETWVTLDGAVQEQCKLFEKESLTLRIQQFLGLPPQEKPADRHFVVMEVNTSDMFRPCANGSLLSTQCQSNFPENTSEAHKAWYAGQSALSYTFPKGYPWTRLGYTYNWNTAASEVGTFEYVIKKGTTVDIVSVTPTTEYCL